MREAQAGRIAGAAAVAIPLLPKCPFCALPFLAAAGIGLPRGPIVEAAIVAAAAVWVGVVVATARWWPIRAGAAAGAALLLTGRLLDAAMMTAAGAVLMFAVALWIAARPRRCHATSGTASPL